MPGPDVNCHQHEASANSSGSSPIRCSTASSGSTAGVLGRPLVNVVEVDRQPPPRGRDEGGSVPGHRVAACQPTGWYGGVGQWRAAKDAGVGDARNRLQSLGELLDPEDRNLGEAVEVLVGVRLLAKLPVLVPAEPLRQRALVPGKGDGQAVERRLATHRPIPRSTRAPPSSSSASRPAARRAPGRGWRGRPGAGRLVATAAGRAAATGQARDGEGASRARRGSGGHHRQPRPSGLLVAAAAAD
jgi:hypothetical protein